MAIRSGATSVSSRSWGSSCSRCARWYWRATSCCSISDGSWSVCAAISSSGSTIRSLRRRRRPGRPFWSTALAISASASASSASTSGSRRSPGRARIRWITPWYSGISTHCSPGSVRRSRCCSSAARSVRAPNSRSTSGCRTPWKVPRRFPRSFTPRRWSPRACTWWRDADRSSCSHRMPSPSSRRSARPRRSSQPPSPWPSTT